MPESRSVLPEIRTAESFDAVRRDEARLRPGVEAILDRHGLRSLPAVRFPDGSLPVYAVGAGLVLKLYPPLNAGERDREVLALSLVDSRLSVPTPAVHAEGELEGWTYVLMTRLHGEPLVAVWPEIPPAERLRLARQLGESLATLHALRDPPMEPLRADWSSFLAAQREGCVERQQRLGLEPRWLEQIPAFLDGTDPGGEPPNSLLHTEVMREHLLARRGADGWTLSGIFDFEPAMVGAPSYEFASVGVFFAGGEREVMREALVAYGYGAPALTPALAERFLALALLHRYSNLAWYLRRLSPPPETSTLAGLARLGWGC